MPLEALGGGGYSQQAAENLQAPGPLYNTTAPPKSNAITGGIDTALKPGWVILALGVSGYLLSETKVFGPLLFIVLAAATIYQLNSYRIARSQGGQ